MGRGDLCLPRPLYLMSRIAYGDPGVNRSSVRNERGFDHSFALQAANAALLAQRDARRPTTYHTRAAGSPVAAPSADWPAHLGWGSIPPRRRDPLPWQQPPTPPTRPSHSTPTPPPPSPTSPPAATTLRAYPSLLTAFLRREMAPVGRLWLIARHLDAAGRGWLPVAALRQAVTAKDAPLRLCGRRRLRQLLSAGAGQLWQRDGQNRLWLYGAARVAANLGLERLQGKPIALPLSDLLAGIGRTRAAFYAAFHAGRSRDPISRATLETLTGVPARTQAHYDVQLDVDRTPHFAVQATTAAAHCPQEHAWQRGGAAFQLTDHRGRLGRAGATYAAFRLPNSYRAPYRTCSRGRQKKINRRLRQDLVTQGTQGNSRPARCFFRDAKQAARAQRRRSLFFHSSVHSRSGGELWHYWSG